MAEGLNNGEIAKRLFISQNTVKNHVRNILEKLQLHSRMEAVVYAVREKILDLELAPVHADAAGRAGRLDGPRRLGVGGDADVSASADVWASTAYVVPSSGTATDTDAAELFASTVLGGSAKSRCTPPALDEAVTETDLRLSPVTDPAEECATTVPETPTRCTLPPSEDTSRAVPAGTSRDSEDEPEIPPTVNEGQWTTTVRVSPDR